VKIHLDTNLCEAYGTCVAAAPDVFLLDPDIDKAIVLVANPDESMRADIEEAVRACPVHAIETVDE
jgi:ferredoxin